MSTNESLPIFKHIGQPLDIALYNHPGLASVRTIMNIIFNREPGDLAHYWIFIELRYSGIPAAMASEPKL